MQENENIKAKSKNKLWIAIVCIILVVAIVSGVLIYFAVKPKEDKEKDKTQQTGKKPVGVHAYLVDEGKKCGYKNAFSELSEDWVTKSGELTYSRYQQNYKGIPVYGQTVVGVTDKDGNVISVTGNVEDVNEEISTTPTVKKADIDEKINTYLSEEYDITDAEIKYDLSDKNLCIYSLYDYADTLCYDLDVELEINNIKSNRQMIINAENGNILYTESGIRVATVTGDLTGDGTRTYSDVTYIKDDNIKGHYELIDTERNITAYFPHTNLVDGDKDVFTFSGDVVAWDDPYQAEQASLDAFANTQVAYDYFADVLSVKSFDGSGITPIKVYTDIEYTLESGEYKCWIDNAFYWGYNDAIHIGRYTHKDNNLGQYLDVVAHEYMHGVENHHSNMDYSGESGAIMEALSDIFGELVESWSTKKEPDWINGIERSIKSPRDKDNPDHYHGDKWGDIKSDYDNGYVHNNSTVISHAAYKMWCSGITSEKLAELWYNAMLMMPVDCNFYECREYVELASRHLGFDESKQKAVSDAFDGVGIISDDEIEEIEIIQNANLYILDFADEYYDNYSYKIWKFDTKTDGGSVLEYPTKREVYREGRVNSVEPIRCDIEKGVYLLEATDNEIALNGEQKKFYRYLIVTDKGEGAVELDADFGTVTISGTVTDSEGNPVESASVEIYEWENNNCRLAYIVHTDINGKYIHKRLPVSEYDGIYAKKDELKSEEVVSPELKRDNTINFKLGMEFDYELIESYLKLFYSCENRYFGMEVGDIKYYGLAETDNDACNKKFYDVVTPEEYYNTDVGFKYGILEEVTNFETEDECFENLRNHFTGEVLDDVMSWNKVNGTYMYNGKLYHLHSGMWGMGSPAKIFYETAKWTKQSDIEYIVTVQSGYVGSDWMWTFKFIVEDGRWKISESKCTEY